MVALTGPRQSDKTTLARAVFSNKPYVSLENPDEREFATQDPKRFLARFGEQGAVIDEIQRCPELLSWLQGVVARPCCAVVTPLGMCAISGIFSHL
ncbi:MAG: AAA family ATPase [Burkholderiaceae bacterium]|nr:AAA family ATPase [Burkholderiaceae bacterium]MCD8565940.1 AAA family ATPase [Burkholderiaceae bacterium]